MKTKLFFMIAFIAMSLNSSAQTIRMGIIGAGAGGWCDTCDIELLSTDNTNYTKANVTLSNGEIKFREIIGTNGVWNTNETSASSASGNFPNGTGVAGGGPAINAAAGVYNVAFNRVTKVYSFTSTFGTLNISGSAVGATPLNLFTADGTNYFLRGQNFTNGLLLVNQVTPSATTWSGTAFPSGTATVGSSGIPVTAGRYNFTFNRTTLAYVFSPVIISITGAGVGGWGTDTNMTTTNGVNYSLNSITITGAGASAEIKFRQNNDWPNQWGVASWPSGTSPESTTGSATNIPAIAGTYSVTFNRVTGAYAFGTLSTNTFKQAGFDVFPNPSNNIFNFTSKNNPISSIEIVDMLGKVVLSKTVNQSEINIDASGLTTGVYFAKVTATDATATVKLIKN